MYRLQEKAVGHAEGIRYPYRKWQYGDQLTKQEASSSSTAEKNRVSLMSNSEVSN